MVVSLDEKVDAVRQGRRGTAGEFDGIAGGGTQPLK